MKPRSRRDLPGIAVLLMLCIGVGARADGKTFAREQVAPGIPYQRALILHESQRQTMVLQTAFDPEASAETIGWVVPLPSVPELSALSEGDEESLFRWLDMRTAPEVTDISDRLKLPLALAMFLMLIGGLLILAVPAWRRRFDRWLSRPVTTAIVLTGLLLVLIGVGLPALASARGTPAVEVLKKEAVGVFDATVIRAETPADLIDWLNQHGFVSSPSDQPVLQSHIDRGWCFVVALVRSEEKEAMIERNRERLIDPLAVTFDAPAPVYPLALTATAGSDTQVLIYLVSDTRWSDDGRLPLRAAVQTETGDAYRLWLSLPKSVEVPSRGWLCKFKATLTPAQMATDLVFTPSSDPAPYRERVVRW